MKKRITLYLLTLLLLFPASFTSAGDEALYGKEPPADAAFFRVLNASEHQTLDVAMAGTKIVTVQPLTVSSYGYTEGPKTVFDLNTTTLTLDTVPGSMTTLVWDGKESFSIPEQQFSNMKKARLKLFNISGTPIRLTTPDKKTGVIDEVAPNTYGFRDVNALTMPFLVTSVAGGEFTTEKISLKKSAASSLFFIGSGSTALFVTSEENR